MFAPAPDRQRQLELCSKLRRARLRAGLTQEEAAHDLGRSQAWLSKTECGDRQITFFDVEDLAALYGVPLAHFVSRFLL